MKITYTYNLCTYYLCSSHRNTVYCHHTKIYSLPLKTDNKNYVCFKNLPSFLELGKFGQKYEQKVGKNTNILTVSQSYFLLQ